MKKMDKNIDILLAKYFANTLDEDERKEVDNWVSESDEHRKIFNHYRHLWMKAEAFTSMSDEQVDLALKTTKKQMVFPKERINYRRLIRQVAAVLIMSLGLSVIYNVFRSSEAVTIQEAMQEVCAIRGGSTKLQLPDGSMAYLFPGSKLMFPTVFKGENREVKLSGEGYFEVQHDQSMPFIVITGQLNIKVLGTEFNVRAYEGEEVVETVLVNGKVAIERQENGQTETLATLKPNQRSVYRVSSQQLEVTDERDLQKYIAWKKGRLVFDGDGIDEMIHQLEKWYHVEIVIADEAIRSYKFTGEFGDEPIQEVLTLLQYSSPFNFKIEQPSVDKNGRDKRKRIVLTSKK